MLVNNKEVTVLRQAINKPYHTHTSVNNRTISVWPWHGNARTKQKQQTNGNRTIWLVYRTDTNARDFRLVYRRLVWKNFMPENFLEINRYFALTSYCNTIGQSNNAFSILGFSLSGNEEFMLWSFHPLADKRNNENLPKPFFKVIWKSLYLSSHSWFFYIRSKREQSWWGRTRSWNFVWGSSCWCRRDARG